MVQILCTHICKKKIRPVETIPEMWRREIKEKDEGGEFMYNISDIL
jgi:hypothetical protein